MILQTETFQISEPNYSVVSVVHIENQLRAYECARCALCCANYHAGKARRAAKLRRRSSRFWSLLKHAALPLRRLIYYGLDYSEFAYRPRIGWEIIVQRLRDRLERLSRGTVSGALLLEQLDAFPVVDLQAITAGRPVLILAPHADDESLGCGGLIAETCRRGHAVHVVVLSDGTGSHPGSKAYPPAALAALRQQETRDALACLGLGAEHVTFMGLPDGRLPQGFFHTRAVARRLCEIGSRIAAATVLATWRFDMHPDHIATYKYGQLVSQALGATFYAYPVWGLILDSRAKLPAVKLTGVTLEIQQHLIVKRRAVMSHISQTSQMITDAEHSFELNTDQLAKFITDREHFIAA